MRENLAVGFALLVGLGAACGQGEDEGGSSSVEPEVTVGSQTLYQIAIRISDAAGGEHEGIAVGSQPFQAGFDRYIEGTQAILAPAGGASRHPLSYAARLDRVRTAMSDALAAGSASLKLAFVFADDDVIGYEGAVGSTRPDRASSSAPTGELSLWFTPDPTLTVVGPYFGYTPQHFCWAAYALGNREPSSTAGDVWVRFWGPVADNSPWMINFAPDHIVVNAASPWYNWGNWQGFKMGFYQVSIENTTWGRTTINPQMGCMFP